jgi:hypothetical protein|uniref:Uncharacterized protein n=1 Tax=Siphoviridae sp. ctgmM3 TaxID=2827912 RepID=A0A8S5TJJ0_9CAUD|nr:MAG TPA: hypothetical protein [Caudoviricetes sp.]DAF63461.1 MAG TPA: hypothetical protein [Siphoviridae sp. ctgmM3]
MAELLINTNEIVVNKGTEMKDIKKTDEEGGKETALLEEINHKLDLLLENKEVEDGKTDH